MRMLNVLSENFNKNIGNIKMKIENIKNNQLEINNIIIKIKNTLQGINIAVE